MTKLHLSSLSINQFRSFRELNIPRLGQINLITGKNAVGKTNLLEALRLYAESGSPRVLRQILIERDEFYRLQNRNDSSQQPSSDNDIVEAVRNLFFGRPDMFSQSMQFTIGPVDGESSTSLSVTSAFLNQEVSEDGIRRYRKLVQNLPLFAFGSVQSDVDDSVYVDGIPGLIIQSGASPEVMLPLNRLIESRGILLDNRFLTPRFPVTYVPTVGLNSRQVSEYWDKTTLTELEQWILSALNAVTPMSIQGINVIGSIGSRPEPTVIVKTSAVHQPIPLRGMGEGLMHTFELVLALVNTRGGVLLIDEIDNGLHHSVQYEIWRSIFRVAQTLDIQVFATTHSWDSVAAFQQAAADNAAMEGMLIRLQLQGDNVTATLFDEHKLAIATREQIEVR